jgi:hypothetical protein
MACANYATPHAHQELAQDIVICQLTTYREDACCFLRRDAGRVGKRRHGARRLPACPARLARCTDDTGTPDSRRPALWTVTTGCRVAFHQQLSNMILRPDLLARGGPVNLARSMLRTSAALLCQSLSGVSAAPYGAKSAWSVAISLPVLLMPRLRVRKCPAGYRCLPQSSGVPSDDYLVAVLPPHRWSQQLLRVRPGSA